jgi:hypothetical protein
MFKVTQMLLTNALALAENPMRLTKEVFLGLTAIVKVLSQDRYELFGRGEDVLSTTPEVVITTDKLSVPSSSTSPGVVVFEAITYEYALKHKDVIVEGKNATWQIIKTYPSSPPATFDVGSFPLVSDNIQLVVTIQPGGEFKRAVVLQEITTD